VAIPDFQTLMLPLLRIFADGQEHANPDTLETLAREFHLTEEERKVRLPSGFDFLFRNRVAWARTHMKAAGLLDNTRRGVFRVTEAGRALLGKKPVKIDLRTLQEFEVYRNSRSKAGADGNNDTQGVKTQQQTPEELIEDAHQQLRDNLSVQILEQLKTGSPSFFEKVVVEVLVKMGYGGSRKDAGEAIGQSGDEGIDGIIKEDRLGLDIIYIQAKKWQGSVSRPEIQKFAGALQGKRARKGIFITTSDFSSGATEYVANIDSKIILIDGRAFAKLMIDFGVGVATEATYEVKRLDSDYFLEN
jgi:restriction system protein